MSPCFRRRLSFWGILCLGILGLSQLSRAQSPAVIAGQTTVCAGQTYSYSVQGDIDCDGNPIPVGNYTMEYSWSAINGTIVYSNNSYPSCDVVWNSAQTGSLHLSIALRSTQPGQGLSPCQDMDFKVQQANSKLGAIQAPSVPVCIYNTFELSYQNANDIGSVEWQQDAGGGSWTSLTTVYAPSADFAYQCGPVSTATNFRAVVTDLCGTVTITAPTTVAVATGAVAAGQAIGERDVSLGSNGTVTLINYSGDILSWQTSVDNGVSWQDVGVGTETITYQGLVLTTWYRAKVRACSTGGTVYSSSCAVRVENAYNWTETAAYAADGTTLTANSRQYFDLSGKPLQTQTKALTAGAVLATQPLYGRYGEEVGSTLPAPVPTTDFAYDPFFITPSGSTRTPYDYQAFDTDIKQGNPDAVNAGRPNSLGWYYSTNNTSEPYTAATAYPYSRTFTSADGSTGVTRATIPGDIFKAGASHETLNGQFGIGGELDAYLALRNKYFTTEPPAPVATPATDIDATGLLARLPFSTSAADVSGMGNQGNVTGGTWITQPFSGNGCLALSGNDYVNIPLTAILTDYTVSFWICPAKLSNYTACLSAQTNQTQNGLFGAFGFGADDQGSIYAGVHMRDASGYIHTGNGVLRPNEWQHYVFTYTAVTQTGTLYRNGAQLAVGTNMSGPGQWTSFLVGASTVSGAPAPTLFDGRISELRIYGRPVSATEVATLYQEHLAALPPANPSPQEPMVWLPFDETGGVTAPDASGNNRAGQLSSGGTWLPTGGKVGGALQLDGTQDIRIPLTGQPTAFTVSFWVKPNQLEDWDICLTALTPQSISGVWGAFAFHTNTSGQVFTGIDYLAPANQVVTNPGVMQLGTWQHYVFSYAAGTGKLYRNGQLLGTSTGMPPTREWTGFAVGGSSVNSQTPFKGLIDELRVHFRALSEAEIQSLYTRPESYLAALGAGPTTLAGHGTQQVSVTANGEKLITLQDQEGRTVASMRPASGAADAWLTVQNTATLGFQYSVQVLPNQSPITRDFTISAPLIVVYDNNGTAVYSGSPAGFDPATMNNTPFKVTAGVPFTLSYSSRVNLIFIPIYFPIILTATKNENLKEFHNFYTLGQGAVTITPADSYSDYVLLNTAADPAQSDVTAAYKANPGQLPAGFYRLLLLKGQVQLAYTNSYQDISYSFYNQLGQPVASLPPNGVKPVLADLTAGSGTYPSLGTLPFLTTSEYNTQGQLLAVTEVDAGRTEYLYRRDGKLRFSQNAKQRPAGRLSYLGYDVSGRTTEAGECVVGNSFFTSVQKGGNTSWLESTDFGGSGLPGYFERRDVVHSYYDVATPATGPYEPPYAGHGLSNYIPAFLSGRVVGTARFALVTPYYPSSYTPVSRTWYSYDEQGRVQWQVSQISESNQPARTLDYAYDALGKATSVCFQKNTATERLTHYYSYDADQRLAKVETGQDDPAAPMTGHAEHARYVYYLHGPLKRILYGQTLQGVDYTYTAQGWLKSINNQELAKDPGGDGLTNANMADLFGLSLHYYDDEKDYTSRNLAGNRATLYALGVGGGSRYDGTLSGTGWQTPALHQRLQAYSYRYDAKSQLAGADFGYLGSFSHTPGADVIFIGAGLTYRENGLSYDPNGNLTHLQRTDVTGMPSLDVNYQYLGNTNKLNAVKDGNNQAITSYTYNEIGQVTEQQELDPTTNKYLDYDVTGKVTTIYRDQNKTQLVARYTYDEAGQRLSQVVYDSAPATTYSTTYFVRDGSGQEVATYVYSSATGQTTLYEQPIYGTSRLGVYRRQRGQETPQRLYELNDNLGNTRVVFREPEKKLYDLTMEDTGTERTDFPEPSAATYDAVRTFAYNHTNGGAASMGLLRTAAQQVSPSKTFLMQRGDKLSMNVFAGYPSQGIITQRSAPNFFVGISNEQNGRAASPTEVGHPVGGWQRVLGRLSFGIAFPLTGHSNLARVAHKVTSTPAAGLQYVIRRADDNSYVDSGVKLISNYADGHWEQLALTLEITQPYPVNVTVNAYNDDSSQMVYFDDMHLEHTTGPIVEENHFYAYGMRNEGLSWQRKSLRSYGRGYQGQNATQDAESGYTAFDLRLYDAHYGRWLATDPEHQFFSSYIGMGNNPVNLVDNDGGTADDQQGPANQGPATQGPGRDPEFEKYHVSPGFGEGVVVVGQKFVPTTDLVVSKSMWLTQCWDMQACNKTCIKMIGYTPGTRIQLYLESGRKLVAQPTLQRGMQRLDAYLAAGKPVMVGVTHTFGAGYNEYTTDHFLVIVGSGSYDGTKYYRYFDPGRAQSKDGTSSLNRMYLQPNGQYSGNAPGLFHKDNTPMNYTLDQVRFK